MTANDWLNDAHEAVAIGKRLGNRVVLIGMSTGASLCLWTAQRDPRVAALVLLSPNFGVADPNAKYALYPWGRQMTRLAQGRYRKIKIEKYCAHECDHSRAGSRFATACYMLSKERGF